MELIMAASLASEHLGPVMVTGDLNDVAWSPTTQQFKKISGLFDPRIGRGFFSTYNALVPFFRMPIDHFFVSRHFQIRKITRLHKIGSDHFPIFTSICLAQEKK